MRRPTLSIIVPTIDRPELARCLASIRPQLLPGDEVLLCPDGTQPVARALWDQMRLPGRYLELGTFRDWGHGQRNAAHPLARGDWLLYMDDDDTYAPDGLETVRQAVAEGPRRLHVFRLKGPHMQMWNAPELRLGDVSTIMLAAPNDPASLGRWGDRYEGDYDFAVDTARRSGGAVFRPETIAYTRPQLWDSVWNDIHVIWLWGDLPELQAQCVQSWMAHGYDVTLWSYASPANAPLMVRHRTLREFLPDSELERWRLRGGTHDGSLVLACDLLQYHGLHRKAGTWVHADCECLGRLPRMETLWIRHWEPGSVCTYAMRRHWQSEIAGDLAERFAREIDPANYHWHDSMRILGRTLRDHGETVVGREQGFGDDWQPGPEPAYLRHWCDSLARPVRSAARPKEVLYA